MDFWLDELRASGGPGSSHLLRLCLAPACTGIRVIYYRGTRARLALLGGNC